MPNPESQTITLANRASTQKEETYYLMVHVDFGKYGNIVAVFFALQ